MIGWDEYLYIYCSSDGSLFTFKLLDRPQAVRLTTVSSLMNFTKISVFSIRKDSQRGKKKEWTEHER
jgi:hypothetical protein